MTEKKDLLFLLERLKSEKFEKLVANVHDKKESVIQIRKLKRALDHGLLLKKLHRVIKSNGKDWLKPSNDMNTDLRKKSNK